MVRDAERHLKQHGQSFQLDVLRGSSARRIAVHADQRRPDLRVEERLPVLPEEAPQRLLLAQAKHSFFFIGQFVDQITYHDRTSSVEEIIEDQQRRPL